MAQYQNAQHYHGIALKSAEEEGRKSSQAVWINWIANSFSSLGQTKKAVEQYEKSLNLANETGDRRSQATALGNLGNAYSDLGDTHKAIEFCQQALIINREIGEHRGESADLGNLGSQYLDLGEERKAIEYYRESLAIKRNIGDRRGESLHTENTGHALLSFGDYQNASENYKTALQIADEILLPTVQLGARKGLAQAYLFQNDLVNARATIETALQYDVPENNHNASALHGIIALRQGDEVAARGAFLRAIGQADEILSKTAEYYSALDAKGLALCGLAIADGGRRTEDGGKTIAEAVEAFRKARKIAPHAGAVKSVLRLFDELVKCDTQGILKDVRNAVEGIP